ncbi:vitamin B12/cobalamin outer membrane transporter [compost metagenome]
MEVRSAIALLPFLLFSVTLWGQDSSSVKRLKTVTVTAKSKYEVKGASQTRIDTLILQRNVNSSLAELLSENTPVFIKSYGRGSLATASFRGTAPSHTQVTWNGININSPMLGMVDFSLIPVYFLDDVNLSHGGASVSNTSGSIGGSIQLDNKPLTQKGWSGQFVQGLGSYSTYDEFGQLNYVANKWQTKTRLYYGYSANDFSFKNKEIKDLENPLAPYPIQVNKEAEYHKAGILQEVYFRPTLKDQLSFNIWSMYTDRKLPRLTTSEADENANINSQFDETLKAVVSWNRYEHSANYFLRLGYDHQDLDFWLKNQISGGDIVKAINSTATSNSFYFQSELNKSFIEDKLKLKGRLDYTLSKVISAEEVKMTGYEENRSDLSFLLSAEANLTKRLFLTALVRQGIIDGDYYASPFLGTEFLINENYDWKLKLNISQTFHYPTLNDLYYLPGGNPNLLPERSNAIEIGTSISKKLNDTFNFWVDINAYSSTVKNWIIWLPSYNQFWVPENMREVKSKGVESKIGISGGRRFTFKSHVNFAWTHSVNNDDPRNWADESVGKQLVYIPEYSGNLFSNIAYKGYYISYFFNYYSTRYTTTSNEKETKRDFLYPYLMSDMAIGKDFKLRKTYVGLQVKVLNLFNEEYRTILRRPMPGRNYYLTIKASF